MKTLYRLGAAAALFALTAATPGPSKTNVSKSDNMATLTVERTVSTNFSNNTLDTAYVDVSNASWTMASTDSTSKPLLPVVIYAVAVNASGVDSLGLVIDTAPNTSATWTADVALFQVLSGTRYLKALDQYGRYLRLIIKCKEANPGKYRVTLSYPIH